MLDVYMQRSGGRRGSSLVKNRAPKKPSRVRGMSLERWLREVEWEWEKDRVQCQGVPPESFG